MSQAMTCKRGSIPEPSQSDVGSILANGHAIKKKVNLGGGGQGSPQPSVSPLGVKCCAPFPGLHFLPGVGFGGEEVISWSRRSHRGLAGSD